MLELSMHIMDIVENSIRAEASEVHISIEEDRRKNLLVIEIRDNGRGMDEELVERSLDPFVTTKESGRVGLGLSMMAEAAKRSGGGIKIESHPGRGTDVRAEFGLTHIDRQPLGNIVETLVTLIIGCPDVEFYYRYHKEENDFFWSTKRIKKKFGGLSRSSPEVIEFVREELNRSIEN